MVNLNVTRLDFAFVLIAFVHPHGAVVVPQFVGEGVCVCVRGEGEVILNWMSKVKGVEKFWT